MSDLPDEETVRSRRTAARGGGPEGDPDETMRAEPSRRRATYAPPSGEVSGATSHDPTAEGSTIIARRESRRRASRPQPSPGDSPVSSSVPAVMPPATSGRAASAPRTAPAGYGARPAAPVRASRTVPAPRVPQSAADGAGAASAQRRRGRRTALVVIFASGAVAFAAAASLVAILLNP